MGFCEPVSTEFMRQTPEFERADAFGYQTLQILVLRSPNRNKLAALKPETDPLKRWKLSPIDKASLDKWEDYTEAKEAMFFYTDTADAPRLSNPTTRNVRA
jgi:polyphosphate kinase